jgi:hypothetical protein
MLHDDEHLAAKSGEGIEIAAKRMAAAHAEDNAQRSIEHSLAALLALSLHLQHVETGSRNFAGAHNLERVREAHPPEVSGDLAEDSAVSPADGSDRRNYRAPRQLTG